MIKIRTKKLDSGFEFPVYGIGLWQMGGRWEADYSQDENEIKAVRAAIDLGVTHIDTAESYGDGHAEEILGKSLEGYDRSKLLIVSKVSAGNQSYDDLLRSFVREKYQKNWNRLSRFVFIAPFSRTRHTNF